MKLFNQPVNAQAVNYSGTYSNTAPRTQFGYTVAPNKLSIDTNPMGFRTLVADQLSRQEVPPNASDLSFYYPVTMPLKFTISRTQGYISAIEGKDPNTYEPNQLVAIEKAFQKATLNVTE